MKHTMGLAFVLVFIVAACGTAPAMELEGEPFRDQANRYTIHFPQGWQHVYLEEIGGHVFYADGEPIEDIVASRAIPQVPVLLVIAGPLDGIPFLSAEGVHDSKTMLGAFLAWLGDTEKGKVGKVRATTVAGQPAAVADIRWPFLLNRDETIAGRAVALYLGERVLFVEAAGREESWKAFKPTFEAILESVTLE